jgi:serine/threonine-protein kinase
VPKGSTVTIVVSTGTQQVSVPNVVGRGAQTATGILESKGFRVREQSQPVTDPAQDGKVQDQFPSSGTQANKGDTVTITVGQLQTPTGP